MTVRLILCSQRIRTKITRAGLPSVLLQYDVSFVVENGASHDTRAYEAFLRAAAQEESSGARRGIARRGQRIVLEENVFLDILFPDRDPNGWDTNDGSIVTLLSYGQSTFLLTGDAPIGVEEYLVRAYGALLDADVLKLGHHGSKHQAPKYFSPRFLPSTRLFPPVGTINTDTRTRKLLIA